MADYVSPGDPGDEQDTSDTVRRVCDLITAQSALLFRAIELAKRVKVATEAIQLPELIAHPLDLELARETGVNLSGVNVLATEAIPVSDSARLPLRGRKFRSGRS